MPSKSCYSSSVGTTVSNHCYLYDSSSLYNSTQLQNQNGDSFTVRIVASGPVQGGAGGGSVHAVAVMQPVQAWTVIRGHDEFGAVGASLATILPGLAPCPTLQYLTEARPGDVHALIKARNELQQWLIQVLMYPGARESPAVRSFLTYDANIMPPQFEGVPWTSFTQEGAVQSPAAAASAQAYAHSPSTPASYINNANLDDMEMDDMFPQDDDIGPGPQDDTDDEEDDFVRPSLRYQPTDEAITEEDEMEIMQLAGEVEMVEDVGSLAQSLGASHLGRSLNLQAEMATRMTQQQEHPQQPPPPPGLSRPPLPQQTGVTLGSAVSGPSTGGIAGAMERAVEGLGDSFNRTRPDSPPRLDSFKMIKVIGKGSFGKVFLVKEIKTGEMFALKVLRKDNIIRRNQVEHTKTERSVLGYVSHPFIVGMNMAFQSKHKLYFVLDYCAGGELFFHLGKLGKFPEPRARFYAAEIILAISYVHSLDIIYRDLKPENVLLDAKGHIRLTDFGLSKEGISASSSGANSFCGTPEYLAPEILNRQGHGRAVDWWSLGALLYEMLTGLPPFYCQNRERLFEKIRKSELHYPASLSAPAKGLLRGLLTKDPDKRLGSGPSDADEIKAHSFFAPINWEKLQKGEVEPPWKPQINGNQDTSQFDKEFTSMPVFSPQSMQRAPGFGATPTTDNPFEGFTFTESILHGPASAQAQNG